ncbi:MULTISPECIES: sulfite exporter TauE/SafE family protein [Enterococcus]|uniref:sulfite exporter TauE/SafE family protein n=1 Tax=Enterococcus TaxID=1350 RepID=UPI0015F24BFC|nr:sulfite exporter TauE/SafE family protein [Enterococcus hirae]MBA5268727.1 sulfite exporter TauE/SafE family protein [Enterococcus hirae]MEB5878440.1 sulfite exporter TauE/SafE family protein [Enterococcus hirae]MEB5905058.1 sulfite exporter TauE/SafE family protein [Enterococcus hirae]
MVQLLLGLLSVLLLYFLFFFVLDLLANKGNWGGGNYLISGTIGVITDFLDTLGIGSFAPTTMLLEFTKQLDNDRQLPGTLNVAHSIPVIIEAFIFITVVKVSPITLFSLVAAAIVGSFVGSKTVSKLPEKKVQFFMGLALIVTAILMGLKQAGMLDLLGSGNEATALTGLKLIIGVIGNFLLGALMTIGVGLYAPCMALVYMLGLSPLVAFPIMMASCAGLMPVASGNFIKSGDYERKVSLAITIGGVIGVIIAVKFVTSLDLNMLTWVIIAVIIYSGITYMRKGMFSKK